MEGRINPTYSPEEVYYFNTHRPEELVKSLQKRYENFDSSKVVEIVEGILQEKVLSCKPDGNFGTGHVIFFVQTDKRIIVFRANVGVPEPEYYMDLESRFIELYRRAGIPVGNVIYSDTSRSKHSFDFQIQKLLPGKDLETEWSGSKEDYDAISYRLGAIVAQEYGCPVDKWGRFVNADLTSTLRGAKNSAFEYLTSYLEYDLNIIQKSGLITARQFEIIKAHFIESREILDNLNQAYLVHHDLADHNIRYSEDGVVAVFDWENAVAFDPVSELASAPTWLCHFPRKEIMIRGFLDTLGYEPENFVQRLALYFLRTMIWKLAFAIKGSRLSERHVKLFNESLKDCNLDFSVTMQAKIQP